VIYFKFSCNDERPSYVHNNATKVDFDLNYGKQAETEGIK
jgi:hypothetical protein